MQLMKDNVTLVNSILQILISTLKFSQKRKIYQPRFTISIEGLFKIYQAVVDVSSVPRSSPASEFGLKVILMSSPPLNIFQMVSSLSLSLSTQCMSLCVADVWPRAKCNQEKLLFTIIISCDKRFTLLEWKEAIANRKRVKQVVEHYTRRKPYTHQIKKMKNQLCGCCCWYLMLISSSYMLDNTIM